MAAPRTFGRDTGLQVRMLLTLFLLGLVYAVLVAVLIAAGAGAITVAVLAAVFFLIQYFASDKIALYSMGAREVTPEQAPGLHGAIERLCIAPTCPSRAWRWPTRRCPTRSPSGALRSTATVCATTGLLELLEPAELDGVLAHELTHVQNRDVMLMTVASFFASIASFIVQMGFWFGAQLR